MWEKEFFRLAAFMLRCRLQYLSQHRKEQRYLEMTLLGYTDTVIEMKLLLKSQNHTCQSQSLQRTRRQEMACQRPQVSALYQVPAQ